MQRSSPSIGTLAAALAKAQGELVNPEKSLVATIRRDGTRGPEQTFRYAPLSSGLDIVRKILGQHEIATVQTTSIDQSAGIINLTTVLAHASGEWIASDWPVCAMSETATPHRMGAALTYARRYALFTLVGIAGEDDLDAPDLNTAEPQKAEKPRLNGPARSTGEQKQLRRKPDRVAQNHSGNAHLKGQLSAVLRDQLVSELKSIGSADAAALWARRTLPAKNSLKIADARQLENAFQARLAELELGLSNTEAQPLALGPTGNPTTSLERKGPETSGSSPIERIENSGPARPEPRRIRDREHVKFVAGHPCLICGRRPADPHHLRFAQSRALGRKVSDEFTVPLCRGHHREIHRYGDEAAWWAKVGVEPLGVANALWRETHPLT
jgi:ERF superfamily